jgi:hypothetical protein
MRKMQKILPLESIPILKKQKPRHRVGPLTFILNYSIGIHQ